LKNGTILKGELNDLEWNVNPDRIKFRETGKEPVDYTVNDVLHFRTDRPALYQSAVVKYDAEGPATPDKMSTNRNATEFVTDTVFVEILVDAPLALGTVMGSNGREYFFLAKNGAFEELVYRKYVVDEFKLGKNELYKQQVLNEAGECKPVKDFIKNLTYTAGSLKIAFTNMNKCQGNEPKKLWEGEASKAPLLFGLAVNPFMIQSNYTAVTTDFGKVNFGAGLFLEKFHPKRPNRISSYFELNFKRFNQPAGNETFGEAFEISNNQLKLIGAMRFSNITQKIEGRNYLEVGALVGLQFNGTGSSTLPALENLMADDRVVGLVAGFGKSIAIPGELQLSAGVRAELEVSTTRRTIGFANSTTLGLVLAISKRHVSK